MDRRLKEKIPIVGTNYSFLMYHPYTECAKNIGWETSIEVLANDIHTPIYTIRPWGFLYTDLGFFVRYENGKLFMEA